MYFTPFNPHNPERGLDLTILLVHMGKLRFRAVPPPGSGRLRIQAGLWAPEPGPITAIAAFPT